jgi:hypothetical protein
MDATPRPFTIAEYNVREGLYANVNFRKEVPTLDLDHFTGVRIELEQLATQGDTTIQLTTTLAQS